MRPLFAYLKGVTAPMSVFAASDDWGRVEGGADSHSHRADPRVRQRIAKAGASFASLLEGRPARPRKKKETNLEDLEVIPFDQLLNG